MAWNVRPATISNADVIVEFNRLMALETEGKTLDLALLTRGVKAALADAGKCRYFLAEEPGIIVGQIGVTTEWSDWRNGWFWWIQSVYVRQEHRRRGVFRALFEHVRRAAKEDREVIGLRLYVDRENHHAQQTYRRLGWSDTAYCLLEQYPLT